MKSHWVGVGAEMLMSSQINGTMTGKVVRKAAGYLDGRAIRL